MSRTGDGAWATMRTARGDGSDAESCAALSAQEARGLALFKDSAKGGCSECHKLNDTIPKPERSLFTDYGFDSVGIPRNPFQYATSIMTNDKVRNNYLKDTTDFYADVESGWLPAFSIIKPGGLLDVHPASSKLDLFEGFSKKVVDAVKNNPALFEDTVIFITLDEGGGYYDSGFALRIDFFGDGTRIR